VTSVEGTGDSVSEAKWNALRELERLAPSLNRDAVRFQVVDEGKRGLLGVGASPARVVATADETDAAEAAEPRDESELGAHLRELLEHVTAAIGLRCRIDIEESDEAITGTCSGGELGLLIGRHGQTIDSLQTLAGAILRQDEDARKQVIVDAAGYRDRRRRTLESIAIRGAEDALRSGERVALEPMSSAERRVVHERLKEYDGVETSSEGDEPDRYVVVSTT
jgi:spoIIIJ-associated protein